MITALLIASTVMSAASLVLNVVAPMTKTTKDDKVLKVLNKIPLDKIKGYVESKTTTEPRPMVRDHRSK